MSGSACRGCYVPDPKILNQRDAIVNITSISSFGTEETQTQEQQWPYLKEIVCSAITTKQMMLLRLCDGHVQLSILMKHPAVAADRRLSISHTSMQLQRHPSDRALRKAVARRGSLHDKSQSEVEEI